jgi:hypothetical protein
VAAAFRADDRVVGVLEALQLVVADVGEVVGVDRARGEANDDRFRGGSRDGPVHKIQGSLSFAREPCLHHRSVTHPRTPLPPSTHLFATPTNLALKNLKNPKTQIYPKIRNALQQFHRRVPQRLTTLSHAPACACCAISPQRQLSALSYSCGRTKAATRHTRNQLKDIQLNIYSSPCRNTAAP